MHHILGNKVLEYDVDDRGVIVDEREYDRTVNPKPNIDGVLNETIIADNLLEKKAIITIVNSSANSERTGKPSFFSTYNNLGYFANLAFYNSIGFDSVPTKQNDGFTEQDLIDYVLENLITK